MSADRTFIRLAALLVLAGEIVYQVAQHFHFEGGRTPIEVFSGYATSAPWTLVHEAQFLASVIVLFGLLALFVTLGSSAGLLGMTNRFAAAAAVAAFALNAVLYAVDGVALKQAVDAWVSASAAEQPAFFAVVQGVRGMEWGLRGYVDYTTGLTLILFAVVIAATGRVPRPVGYLMGLAGVAYAVQGYGYGRGYTAISGNQFVLNSSNYEFLMVVWAIWLLVSTFLPSKEVVQAAPA